MPTSAPPGSVSQANPRSIVMPRSRSSRSRSGSIPVRARMSVDLPWSTWPAVPMTRIGASAVIARRASVRTSRTGSGRRRTRAVAAPRSRSRARSTSPAAAGATRALRHADRDALDLHAQAFRERGYADGRARGAMIAEPLRVHLVHGGEVVEVHQIDGRLHHVPQVRSGRREHRDQVVEHAL